MKNLTVLEMSTRNAKIVGKVLDVPANIILGTLIGITTAVSITEAVVEKGIRTGVTKVSKNVKARKCEKAIIVR